MIIVRDEFLIVRKDIAIFKKIMISYHSFVK